MDNMEQMGVDNKAESAFVLFRSMEGVERAMKAFSINWYLAIWLSFFTCCMS